MYMNVFLSRKRADMDTAAYAADDARMELAADQPGFVSFKTFAGSDGENLSVSVWESGAHARAWGLHPDHAPVKERGWADYYDSYTMYGVADPVVKHFARAAS